MRPMEVETLLRDPVRYAYLRHIGAYQEIGPTFGKMASVAGGAGLRLGWAWLDPGPRTRTAALGVEGRAMAAIALGLVPVFAVAGSIEGFVTPSPLWSWLRLTIGALALLGVLVYVAVLGGRGARAGELGDLGDAEGAAVLPVAG